MDIIMEIKGSWSITGILFISVCKFECVSEIFDFYKSEKSSLTHSNIHRGMSKIQVKLHI